MRTRRRQQGMASSQRESADVVDDLGTSGESGTRGCRICRCRRKGLHRAWLPGFPRSPASSRACSSSALTAAASVALPAGEPGRVLSAPRSSRSAPSSSNGAPGPPQLRESRKQTAVTERVRRDVDDAHDQRSRGRVRSERVAASSARLSRLKESSNRPNLPWIPDQRLHLRSGANFDSMSTATVTVDRRRSANRGLLHSPACFPSGECWRSVRRCFSLPQPAVLPRRTTLIPRLRSPHTQLRRRARSPSASRRFFPIRRSATQNSASA